MTSGRPVCDTTVLIDYLRGQPDARAYLRSLTPRPRCSEMTRVEVLRGIRSAERSAMARLLASCDWIPVDTAIATRAGELGRRFRRSHQGINTVDLIVAATALELGTEVATSNIKHFPMFQGLRPVY